MELEGGNYMAFQDLRKTFKFLRESKKLSGFGAVYCYLDVFGLYFKRMTDLDEYLNHLNLQFGYIGNGEENKSDESVSSESLYEETTKPVARLEKVNMDTNDIDGTEGFKPRDTYEVLPPSLKDEDRNDDNFDIKRILSSLLYTGDEKATSIFYEAPNANALIIGNDGKVTYYPEFRLLQIVDKGLVRKQKYQEEFKIPILQKNNDLDTIYKQHPIEAIGPNVGCLSYTNLFGMNFDNKETNRHRLVEVNSNLALNSQKTYLDNILKQDLEKTTCNITVPILKMALTNLILNLENPNLPIEVGSWYPGDGRIKFGSWKDDNFEIAYKKALVSGVTNQVIIIPNEDVLDCLCFLGFCYANRVPFNYKNNAFLDLFSNQFNFVNVNLKTNCLIFVGDVNRANTILDNLTANEVFSLNGIERSMNFIRKYISDVDSVDMYNNIFDNFLAYLQIKEIHNNEFIQENTLPICTIDYTLGVFTIKNAKFGNVFRYEGFPILLGLFKRRVVNTIFMDLKGWLFNKLVDPHTMKRNIVGFSGMLETLENTSFSCVTTYFTKIICEKLFNNNNCLSELLHEQYRRIIDIITPGYSCDDLGRVSIRGLKTTIYTYQLFESVFLPSRYLQGKTSFKVKISKVHGYSVNDYKICLILEKLGSIDTAFKSKINDVHYCYPMQYEYSIPNGEDNNMLFDIDNTFKLELVGVSVEKAYLNDVSLHDEANKHVKILTSPIESFGNEELNEHSEPQSTPVMIDHSHYHLTKPKTEKNQTINKLEVDLDNLVKQQNLEDLSPIEDDREKAEINRELAELIKSVEQKVIKDRRFEEMSQNYFTNQINEADEQTKNIPSLPSEETKIKQVFDDTHFLPKIKKRNNVLRESTTQSKDELGDKARMTKTFKNSLDNLVTNLSQLASGSDNKLNKHHYYEINNKITKLLKNLFHYTLKDTNFEISGDEVEKFYEDTAFKFGEQLKHLFDNNVNQESLFSELKDLIIETNLKLSQILVQQNLSDYHEKALHIGNSIAPLSYILLSCHINYKLVGEYSEDKILWKYLKLICKTLKLDETLDTLVKGNEFFKNISNY